VNPSSCAAEFLDAQGLRDRFDRDHHTWKIDVPSDDGSERKTKIPMAISREGRHIDETVYSAPSPDEKPGTPSSLDFRTVFETYSPFVARTLRRLDVPSADLHDLLQEIFVVVHRKLCEYDGRAPLRGWIYGICMRTASTYRRSARVRLEETWEGPALEIATSRAADTQGPDLDTRRACAHAEALLSRLDEEKRRVFVLYEIEGLSMAEIAEAIGCPLQTAYSRLHAARKAMKVLLQRSLLARSCQT
jgi:RNA polymerase sigma-70 factor (ECF subfamily)